MALSDKEISALYFEALGSQHLREPDRKMVTRFAHAVESEVRKQDDALILQLVEALESSNVEWKQLADSGDAGFWRAEDQDYYQQSEKAIVAGRARLEGFAP